MEVCCEHIKADAVHMRRDFIARSNKTILVGEIFPEIVSYAENVWTPHSKPMLEGG